MDEKLLNNRIIQKDIDFVKMLSEGMTVGDISKTVGMKPKTIEARLMRLRTKLKIKSAAELTAYFLRNDIIK